ncbi:MAG: VCBS domain-containing protein [Hyphomicrobiaceae bacterium]
MADGDTATETFTVTIDDGEGGTVDQVVSVTITGTNDAAVLSSAVVALDETNAALTTGGTLTNSDVDNDDTFVAQVGTAGANGTFSIDTAGVWSYTANSAFDSLNVGDSVSDTFTVAAADGTTTTVQVTINGTNDAATISGVVTGSVTEDAIPVAGRTATGSLTVVDVDDPVGPNAFVAETITGAYGTLTITGPGAWTYTLTGSADVLNQGQVVTDIITVTTAGGDTQSITITVTGTNDGPVVSGIVTQTVTEDTATAVVDLLVNVSDADGDQVLHIVPGSGNLGSLPAYLQVVGDSIEVDTTNAAYDSLGVGETVTHLVSYQVTDNHGATVVQTALITVTGANASPTAAALTLSGTEDGGLQIINLLQGATDGDGDALTASAIIESLPVGFTQFGNILIVDTSAATFQSLAVGGAGYSQAFTYTISDGQGGTITQTVTVNVAGSNDSPVVTAVVGAVDEDLTTSGSLAGTDVDTGETAGLIYALVGPAPAGFALTGTGPGWTFDAASYDSLAQGQTLTLVIPYTATDVNLAVSNVGNLTITVTGTNDVPVVTAQTANATEGGASVTVNGLATASDIDGGALSVVNATTHPAVMQTGNSFTLDASHSSFDSLVAGATTTVTITYDVSDTFGTSPSSITFTVVGTNDVAVIGGVVSGTVTEDALAPGQTATGALTIADLDAGQSAVVAIPTGTAGDNGFGTFAVLADGTWTYTLSNGLPAVQALGAGQTLTDRITVTSADGSDTQVITVTINGSNDGPVAVAQADFLREDVTTASSGSLFQGITDGDAGTTLSLGAVTAAGGPNPLIGATTVPFTSGSGPTADTFDTAVIGQYGTLAYNATTGIYVYFISNNLNTIQQLTRTPAPATQVDDVFSFQVSDGNGGTVTQTVTMTIRGNDDGTVTRTDFFSAAEDDNTLTNFQGPFNPGPTGAPQVNPAGAINVLANDTDNDAGQSSAIYVTGFSVAGGTPFSVSYGSAVDVPQSITLQNGAVLTIAPTGAVTFVQNGAYDSLASGQVVQQFIGYSVTSPNGVLNGNPNGSNSLIIGIGGTNDSPTVTMQTATATEDGAAVTVNALAEASDVDNGAVLTAIVDLMTLPPGVSYAGGVFTLDPNDPSFDDLAAGAPRIVTVSYSVQDEYLASAPATVQFTVVGTNDAPTVASAVINVAVTEDQVAPSPVTVDLLDGVTDVDGGPLTVTILGALPPGVTMGSATEIDIDPSAPAFQSLGNTGSANLAIHYVVSDGAGGMLIRTANITVTGVNDAPTVTGVAVGAAAEDSGLAAVNLLANASDIEGQTLSVAPGVMVTAFSIGSVPQLVPPGGIPVEDFGASVVGGQVVFDTNTLDIDLAAGEVAVLTFGYTVQDTQGGMSSATATFTLTGVNDAPYTTGIQTDSVTEGTGIVVLPLLAPDTVAPIDGHLYGDNIRDEDFGDTLTVVSISGAPAGVTLNAGVVSFDTNHANYNGLAAGQTQTFAFTFVAQDAAGAQVTQTANVTITGTNDGPVATAVTSNLREDVTTATYGNLFASVSDADAGANLDVSGLVAAAGGLDINGLPLPPGSNSLITAVAPNATFPNVIVGQFGTLTYNPTTGDYQYFIQTNLSTIQALVRSPDSLFPNNPNVTDTFTFTVTDGTATTTQTVNFRIRGNDDGISVRNDFMTGTEDSGGLNNTSSTFTPALGDALITPTAINVLANDFDLDAGQTSLITVTTFNLSGFGPVAAGNTVTLPNGATLSIATNGALTFNQNGAYDSLGQGDFSNVVVFYAAQGLNGPLTTSTNTATLTIRIAGTNDGPVVTAMTIPVSEDGPTFSVPALLQSTDVDSPTLTVVDVMPILPDGVTYSVLSGEFTIDPSDAAYQSLGVGETATVEVTYSVSDGIAAPVPTTLTFEVVGTNDVPVVSTATATVNEDSTTSGTVAGTDADGDGLTYALVGPAPTGLTFNSDGTWEFDADSYDSLAEGATLVLSVAYSANDGTATSPAGLLEITITGANDGPSAVVHTATAIEGGAAVSVDGLGGASDGGDGGALTVSYTSLPDGVTELDGVFTLDPTHASFNSLPAGATATVIVDYDVSDGVDTTPTTITFTVVGTNDGATIGGTSIGTVTEDTATTVSDALTIADDDTGEAEVQAIPALTAGDNGYGTFEVAADGTWTYTLDNGSPVVNALGDGDTLTDRITVTSADGSDTQVIEVTIQGTNDAPVVVPAAIPDITEDTGVHIIDLLDGVTDVEGQTLTVSDLVFDAGDGPEPLPAFITLAGGNLVFDSNAAGMDIAQGESVEVTITYDVTDSQGETVGVTRTVTIHGANDAPTVSGPITAPPATEGVVGLVTVNALTNVSDLDTSPAGMGITGVQEQLAVIPPVSLPAGVSYAAGEFSLDPADPAFDSLAEGQTHTIIIDYAVTDGVATVPHQVVFTVTGTNDGPVATGGTASTNEDTAVTINVASLIADADDADSALTVAASVSPTEGTVVVTGTTVQFTPAANFHGTASITFTATDPLGLVSNSGLIAVTVAPQNDAPTANAAGNSGTTNEDVTLTGTLPAGADIDGDSPLTYFTVGALPAGLSLLSNGAFTYVPPTNSNGTVSFQYLVQDPTGAQSAPQTFTINVTPVNDAPSAIALSGASGAGALTVLEHTPGTVGTLSTTDVDSTTHTYTIVGGTGASRFTLGGANGNEILVAANTTLDFERDGATPFTLTVRSTDGSGATVDRTFSLSIGNMAVDNIFGSAAADNIHGGAPNEIIYGLGGNDFLVGNGGVDQLFGGDGDDTLNGGEGNDILTGNAGADGLIGGTGNDTIAGGDGEDWAVGGDGDDGINGDAGNDVLYGNAGADWIIGGAGNDFIDGGADGDVIYGSDGADGIFGGAGVDFIVGGTGNDTIYGQDDADGIFGGADADFIDGGAGNDTILGEDGGDILMGGLGVDTIDGGAGNDSIRGGVGLDFLTGGAGVDTFAFEDGDSVTGSGDYIQDWQNGTDFIDLTGIAAVDALNDLVFTQSGSSVVITGDGLELIVLNANTGDFDAADFYFHPST